MRFSTQIKPISYVKSHAAELMDRIADDREPIIITKNGEAKAVLVDVRSYEETQENLALLKIIAAGRRQSEAGDTYSVEEAMTELRRRRTARVTSPDVSLLP